MRRRLGLRTIQGLDCPTPISSIIFGGAHRAISRAMTLRHLCFAAILLSVVSGCSAATESDPPPTSDPIVGAAAAPLAREDLPEGAFRTRAEELAQEWLDGNIMTGDPRIDAGVLKGALTPAALEKFASKVVADRLADGEMTLRDEKTESPALDDALVKEAAKVA